MNERIKELAKQAGIHPCYAPPVMAVEKFAELIVRDCCDIVNQEALLTAHVPAEVNALIGERLKSVFIKIEEHFGIK